MIVEKNGNIKPLNVKNAVETDFYKKAGFKSAEGFHKHTTWKVNSNDTEYHISLYGKITGKANTENKFEFPPPVDNVLFFGNCILANVVNGVVTELDGENWGMIYDYLYGEFENLSEEEADDEDEEEDDTALEKTKDGYAKDGFIVDDNEEEENEESESESELSSVESAPKRAGRKPAKPVAKGKKTVELTENNVDVAFDCTSELSEDSYDL